MNLTEREERAVERLAQRWRLAGGATEAALPKLRKTAREFLFGDSYDPRTAWIGGRLPSPNQ